MPEWRLNRWLSSARRLHAGVPNEVEMILGRSRQDADEDDAVRLDGNNLSDRQVGFLIAHHDVLPFFQLDSRGGIAHVGMGQAVAVGALVVHPQIPRHSCHSTT